MSKKDEFAILNFKQLSDFGLIAEINTKILHPLGLALCYDRDTGVSNGAIIANDLNWEYAPEVYDRNKVKLDNFKRNRITILKKILEQYESQQEN